MKIGIGLPSTIAGTPGELIVDWARHAEDAGFATIATIDRVAYPSYSSLISLAAAAAVTSQIGLLTNVLIAPTHNAVLLAKDAASVDQLSGGRLRIGLGVGGREDDYTSAGLDFSTRGRLFDEQLAIFKKAWAGDAMVEGSKPVAPATRQAGGVPILIGGSGPHVIDRMVKYGVGWTIAGMPPDAVGPLIEEARTAWRDAGREGSPQITALGYYAIGDDANVDYLRDYYAFLGPVADMIADGATRTPEEASEVIAQWDALGIDEYIFNPTYADIAQVERLAAAVV